MKIPTSKKNHVGLVEYLGRFGLDARHILEAGIGRDGYDAKVFQHDGRPAYDYGHHVKIERREWPSQIVYINVVRLLGGADVSDLTDEADYGDDVDVPPSIAVEAKVIAIESQDVPAFVKTVEALAEKPTPRKKAANK